MRRRHGWSAFGLLFYAAYFAGTVAAETMPVNSSKPTGHEISLTLQGSLSLTEKEKNAMKAFLDKKGYLAASVKEVLSGEKVPAIALSTFDIWNEGGAVLKNCRIFQASGTFREGIKKSDGGFWGLMVMGKKGPSLIDFSSSFNEVVKFCRIEEIRLQSLGDVRAFSSLFVPGVGGNTVKRKGPFEWEIILHGSGVPVLGRYRLKLDKENRPLEIRGLDNGRQLKADDFEDSPPPN